MMLSKMSLPSNLQHSSRFMNCGNGRSRQLLFYEAGIMDTLNGPMTMMGSTISHMLQYMWLKAQTPEEKLFVRMLMEKVYTEYIASASSLMLIVDKNLDIKAELEKAFAESFKKRNTPPEPKPEPPE